LVALMTILALVPLGAVVGVIVGAKVGGDLTTYALGGAVGGFLVALWTKNR
jgi:hypothetical protein